MIPNPDLITITDNESKIVTLLQELVLQPRLKALQWSKITKQTPNMKIGYPGQHLASLITGIEGARTGARGDDLRDGTEVKSCSRVDQLDTCNDCKNKVLRSEENCPHCGSANIKRMDDSKWLFSIKSEAELELLTNTIDRVFLTIADYPNFADSDFNVIRFQAFEIWVKNPRHRHFTTLMQNYYNKLFLEHIKLNANKTPAPKNFWPFSYQFYLCNPVRVFNCLVTDANNNPNIEIKDFVQPNADRALLIPEIFPTILLSQIEWKEFFDNADELTISSQIKNGTTYQELVANTNATKFNREFNHSAIPYLNENAKSFLQLRDTDVALEAKVAYSRRK